MTSKFLKYGFLLSLAVAPLFTACEEQILNKFEDASSLYFFNGASNNRGDIQRDSVNYSFFLAGSRTVDTVWLDVRLTGSLSDAARPIPIVQTNGDGEKAAVAGRDYVGFDDPEINRMLVMPANATSASIPVVVLRTAAMETDEFRLDLEITSNEYFVVGIDKQQTYTIKITAMASQPAMWENNAQNGYFQTFGTWGQEKMRFIIDYTGYSAFEETLTGTAYTDIRRFLNMKVRKALEDYVAENGPLYEADDLTEVTFPQM